MAVSRRVLSRHIAQQLVAGEDRAMLMRQLASYLVVNRQTSQIELVVADIVRNLAELGTVKATVTVAHPMTSELRALVESYVRDIEEAADVQFDEVVDPTIIGGVIIETPRKRFDASIATQLKRLRNV